MSEDTKKGKSRLLRKIGANLKAIRKEKGIEVKQISAWLGLSQQAYLNMENGKTDISLTRILELTEHLNVNINRLLDIECPGLTLQSKSASMISYGHSSESNFKVGGGDSVTKLLEHQMEFLHQQYDRLATMLGIDGRLPNYIDQRQPGLGLR